MKTESIGLRKGILRGLAALALASGTAFNVNAEEKKHEYKLANTGVSFSYSASELAITLPTREFGNLTFRLTKKATAKEDKPYEEYVTRVEAKTESIFDTPEFLKSKYDEVPSNDEYLVLRNKSDNNN